MLTLIIILGLLGFIQRLHMWFEQGYSQRVANTAMVIVWLSTWGLALLSLLCVMTYGSSL